MFTADIIKDGDEICIETDQTVIKRLDTFRRIIYSSKNNISTAVQAAANSKHVTVISNTPMIEGRIELLNYLEEQTISNRYHRYGNIGGRETNERLGN